MSNWEDNIYRKGKQLNKYPNDSVISFIFSNYGSLSKEEISKIKVLDLGCGAGNNSLFLSEFGFETYGVDISPSAIEFAKDESKKLGKVVSFITSSFTKLPYEENFFDLVIDRGATTCCPEENLEETINEISRILKINGTFKSIDFYNKFNSSNFKKILTEKYGNINFSENFLELLKKKFKIEHIEQVNKIYPMNNDEVEISFYNLKCLKRKV